MIFKVADAIRYRIQNEKEETLPVHMVREPVHSEHPIRVWREYRGLTLQTLAERIGISNSYLSQIECGYRSGSADVLKRIAAELQITVDDII